MAVQIMENVWCYNELDCSVLFAEIIRKQMTNESLFVKFIVEIAFRVVILVYVSNIINILLPKKNLFKSLIDSIRIVICLIILTITCIYLF
jgi:hypothetical protein